MSDELNVPAELLYTKEHEWVRIEGDTAIIGITDHAQSALGEITYVELPPLENGYIKAPPGPGLGTRLQPDVLKRKDAQIRRSSL